MRRSLVEEGDSGSTLQVVWALHRLQTEHRAGTTIVTGDGEMIRMGEMIAVGEDVVAEA